MADVSEQMIWKGGLQGFLQEASMLGSGTEQYYLETSDNEGEVMRALRDKIASTIWSHKWLVKRTMFAYDPEVSTDPLEAQFLKALSKMKQPRRTLEIDMFTGYGAAAMLKDCENATLVSLEIDPFLKPWVRECLTSRSGPLLTHSRRCLPPKRLTWVFIDTNKSEYKRYVEVLIARSLLAKNAMIVADNTLYCGIPSTLSESCFLVVTEPKKRSNTTNDRNLSTVIFGGVIVSCSSQTGPWIQSTSPKKWQIRTVQQSYGNWETSRTAMRSTTTRLKRSMRQSTIRRSTERQSAQDTTEI